MECRCRILNVLTGTAARDYASVHLEPIGASRELGSQHLRCPDTGTTWTYEPDWQPGVPRLRRAGERG